MLHYAYIHIAGKMPAVKMSLKLNNSNGSECYFHLNNNNAGMGAKTMLSLRPLAHTIKHTHTTMNNEQQ